MYKKALLLIVLCTLPLLTSARQFWNNPTPVPSNPEVLKDSMAIRVVMEVNDESVGLKYNTTDETLYMLRRYGQIYSIDIEAGTRTELQNTSDHGLENTQGFDISSEGVFYVVGNLENESESTTQGIIKRGVVTDGNWEWSTVAETEPWPLSNTFFDHVMNGIVISPDDQYLFINSGSRTDHGEAHSGGTDNDDLREVPLTAKIFRIPADGDNIILENDYDYLRTNGYIYAEGIRNSFSLAFDRNGNLFALDNAGERDDPEEMNWIREGHHYGFPWVVGGNENPMQFEGYDPDEDALLPDETGSRNYFYNDPDFPPPPEGVTFTPAIPNYGPDAVLYRDPETGNILNAAEQDTFITSFTGHRSPLGLVFDTDSLAGGEFSGDAFMLGFAGARNDNSYLLAGMDDEGEDLLHLKLTETEDGFQLESHIIARGFFNPVDSELIGNKMYVVEFKGQGWLNMDLITRIYEVTLSGASDEEITETDPTQPDTTDTSADQAHLAEGFVLDQNYPNPFNPTTVISYQLPANSDVRLAVYDVTGRLIETLIDQPQHAGRHQVTFNAEHLTSGVYFYRLEALGAQRMAQTGKMLLLK